jgi:hypothetical protein
MDIIQVYLTRFLSQQDEKLCEKDPTRSKSVYYPYFLHNYIIPDPIKCFCNTLIIEQMETIKVS